MGVKFNENKEVVRLIKEGLEKNGGYCPCRTERTPIIKMTAAYYGREMEKKYVCTAFNKRKL